MHLSIIIPAYNEEARLPQTLKSINSYLRNKSYHYEIIVVNDGSLDNTAGIVKNLISDIKNLRFIDIKENQGKGHAVKQGILNAQGQYCIYLDADNAISFDQIENFWPYLDKGYDITLGSIEIKGARIIESNKQYRLFLGKLSKYLIRFLTIWEIHDSQRAFKLLATDKAKNIFSKLTIKRWGFDIEVLVIAKKLNYSLKELPVTWINPSGSKVTLGSYWTTLKELLKIKYNLLTGKYN